MDFVSVVPKHTTKTVDCWVSFAFWAATKWEKKKIQAGFLQVLCLTIPWTSVLSCFLHLIPNSSTLGWQLSRWAGNEAQQNNFYIMNQNSGSQRTESATTQRGLNETSQHFWFRKPKWRLFRWTSWANRSLLHSLESNLKSLMREPYSI